MGSRIVVNPVTRIEGHAKIILEIEDSGELKSGHMQVLEIRGFEKLLQGMELLKMPQMTARLCGVCPAAHHLVATAAIEQGMGVTPPRDAKLLRELLYAGHVLHSHALSNFVLTGPDLILGINAAADKRNVFNLLAIDPELSKTLLRIRSIGQRTVELVGGRGVHPVTAIPGGMASRPTAEKLELMAGWGEEATESLEAGHRDPQTQARRARPAARSDPAALSLTGPVQQRGRRSPRRRVGGCRPRGQRRTAVRGPDYGDNLVEHVMPGSYMKSVQLKNPGPKNFFVGPLARLNVNSKMTTPKAQAASRCLPRIGQAAALGGGLHRGPAHRHAQLRRADQRHRRRRARRRSGQGRCPKVKAGRYVGVIEAPRGILVHDYTTDDDGRITDVNLIVATQNNYDAIDSAV